MKKKIIFLFFMCNLINAQFTLTKDIRTGTTGSALSTFLVYNNTLYFKANDGTIGSELWKSDGTNGGTVLVTDYNTGSASFNPSNLTLFNSKIYFTGLTSTFGNEVFSFDGNTITNVADIKTGTGSSAPSNLVVFNGNLYFRAQEATTTNSRLYKLNTSNVYNILDSSIFMGLSSAVLGNQLLFAGGTASNNMQLYSTDGTTISLVKTINASATSSLANIYTSTTLGKSLFSATDGSNGRELWITDGTTAGTILLKDINVGAGDSLPSDFYEYNNKIYFQANDGTNGAELWVTDGTTAGTLLLKNINTTASTGSNPSNYFAYNGKLYFSANNGINGTELWSTDGTETNTIIVSDFFSGTGNSSPSDLTLFNGTIYLALDNGTTGKELFSVDSNTLATENILLKKHSITPNPSNGNVKILNINQGVYQLFTLDGKFITSNTFRNSEIQFKNIVNGIYLLKIINNKTNFTTRIIIKN